MDENGYRPIDDFRGRALSNVTAWTNMNLYFVTKPRMDRSLCTLCGRFNAAHKDTPHLGTAQPNNPMARAAE